MIVYRLSKSIFASDLSGRGAEIAGGRWNSIGVPIVYTGESRALATAEVAVHISRANIPTDYSIISIEFPDDSIFIPEVKTLPINWADVPPQEESKEYGDNFVDEGQYLVMKVPSAVIPGDFNYLINSRHKDIGLVKIIDILPYPFDKRLFKA